MSAPAGLMRADAADGDAVPALTIARAAPADAGLDYQVLVDEGTRLVQALSGKLWTNFNYSDPGVTILEQLCYALTELSYRAGFALPDLLGAPGTGAVSLERQGLHPARTIMPVNPVTAADLRRLLLDRVHEAGNVWLTPLPAGEAGGVAGLYRIDVLPQHDDCRCDEPDQAQLVARVLDCYSAHRALCEDVSACVALSPLPTRLQGRVLLDRQSDPDAVLASLLFAVGMVLAPEPRRTSLAALRAAGRTTAEIFQGPLPLHGFIGEDQLAPLPRLVPVAAVLEAMASVPGVLAIDGLTLYVQGHRHGYRDGDTIDAGCGNILTLKTGSAEDGLVLYCGDLRCSPSPARVRRLLERAWAEQRRTYRLADEYDVLYPVPDGAGMDLSRYSSVQDQFPAVYGIGPAGLPSGADRARQAQARQLKGYLMAFDQLMADYFSQLAFVRELFSVAAGGASTYAWQSLRHIVPDAAPLLMDDYERGMARLTARNDPVVARQGAVLGFLLSLYASPLDAPNGGAETAAARQALLVQIVAATGERGRGIDYRRDHHAHAQAGLEVRSRIELALLEAARDGVETGGADDARQDQLYIVEWVLLRDALGETDSDSDIDSETDSTGAADGELRLEPEEFNFRISAVMPAWHGRDRDGGDDAHDDAVAGWRRQVRAILRENTSAHVVVDDIFLGHRRMAHFLRLYERWRHALRHGSALSRRAACLRLARFLKAARRPDAPQLARAPAPIPASLAAPACPTVATAHAPAPSWRRLPRGAAAAAAPPGAQPRLSGSAEPAQPGACGAYVEGPLDSAAAQAFAEQGFAFVLRELAWGDPAPAQAFSTAEADAILQAGLALMPVQRIVPDAWPPEAGSASEEGARAGRRTAALAHRIGFPAGVTVWLLVAAPCPPEAMQSIVDYCNAWYTALAKVGYEPGLCLLQARPAPADYAQLLFEQYWGGGPCLRGGPPGGACLVRASGGAATLAGVSYEWNFIEAARDALVPAWLAGAA